ncbi:hypothetical protein BN1723_019556, partial [Verticillium longisporum]
STRSSCS